MMLKMLLLQLNPYKYITLSSCSRYNSSNSGSNNSNISSLFECHKAPIQMTAIITLWLYPNSVHLPHNTGLI